MPTHLEDEKDEDQKWKLDRHIPLALIFTILGQFAYMVWWISGTQNQMQDHEKRIVAQESSKVAERMAVVEVQIRASRELQIEMNQKLDRLLDYRSIRSEK